MNLKRIFNLSSAVTLLAGVMLNLGAFVLPVGAAPPAQDNGIHKDEKSR